MLSLISVIIRNTMLGPFAILCIYDAENSDTYKPANDLISLFKTFTPIYNTFSEYNTYLNFKITKKGKIIYVTLM